MTRKDYILIAEALATAKRTAEPMSPGAKAMHREASESLAMYLGQANPRFDSARFLKAAGVDA